MDQDIQNRIKELIEEEHKLRSALGEGEISAGEEQSRLGSVEAQLDQCWDLLRQRRARREFGEDVDRATPRSVSEVEDYLQ